MEDLILLTPLQVLDLFSRFAAAGALFVLLLKVSYRAAPGVAMSYGALVVCFIAYLLLTAPIANQHYGGLRPPLLLLTDLIPLVLLNLYWLYIRGKPLFDTLPRWLQMVIFLWIIWVSYFFLVEAGRGIYHDLHHALGLSILVYILIDAFKGFDDELVESRRQLRLVMIAAISLYMMFLTLIELSQSELKNHWLFSLGNGLTALLVSVYGTSKYLQTVERSAASAAFPSKSPRASKTSAHSDQHPLVNILTDTMQKGFYTQNGVTIDQLASELKVPPHQLRRVINTQMGFDNFSQFINSYRIPAVCGALTDPSRARDSILTIALEAGFNSIAPFNRAFKQQMNITPSEYRERFQK